MVRRNGITDVQRQQLRVFYTGIHPRPSQKRCQIWFQEQFHRPISQATVSELLQERWKDLDLSTIVNSPSNQVQKHRSAQWPELEAILMQWQQEIEARGGVTSQDLLRGKAREIWSRINVTPGISPPEFSNGWLQRF